MLTFLIAQICIVLGDLNAIAPIITMFFMITYGLLNLASFYEAITKNPSYRPTFRYSHWSASLAGAVGCLAVMFLINWVWALASIVVIAALHWYIRYREIESRWGDLQSGAAFERARKSLLRLEDEAYHSKNWRPIILALSGTGWTRPHIAIYGHWLSAGHGILSLAHVVAGDLEKHAERRDKFEATLRSFIAKEELQAFPAVVVSQYLSDGIESLIQCHGIGGLRPNTVLMGWPNDVNRVEAFGDSLRLIGRLGRSSVAARFLEYRAEEADESNEISIAKTTTEDDAWTVPIGTIDVWWRGKQNGGLMLLLAHLLHQNTDWRDHPIRILRVVSKEEAVSEVKKHVETLCALARIAAETVVLVSSDPSRSIHETSANSAVVLIGISSPEEGAEVEFFNHMEELAGSLPRVLFVESAGGMELES